jgi:hypothetical protein
MSNAAPPPDQNITDEELDALKGERLSQKAQEFGSYEQAAAAPPRETGILAANGFDVVRRASLQACEQTMGIPLDTLKAGLAYSAQEEARLRLDTDPRAADAIRAAQADQTYLRLVIRFRKELQSATEKLAALQKLRP